MTGQQLKNSTVNTFAPILNATILWERSRITSFVRTKTARGVNANLPLPSKNLHFATTRNWAI